MEERPRYTIQAVERVLKVLDCFSVQRPELTLSEICVLLAERKGTVYRFITTLVHTGFLELNAEARRYRLGRKLLVLGHVAMQSVDIRRQSLPHLQRLAEEINENVNLAILDGDKVLFLEHVESRQMLVVRLRVGERISLHASSLGKVLLAALPDREIHQRMETLTLERFTARTITDRETFRAELEQVRQLGYGLSDEELADGLISVATPIRGWDGTVVAAVNVACLRHRMPPERILTEVRPRLMATTEAISAALGAPVSTQS